MDIVQKINELFDKYIGLTKEEAYGVAKEDGYEKWGVYKIDNNCYATTCDFNPKRILFNIKNNKVVDIKTG